MVWRSTEASHEDIDYVFRACRARDSATQHHFSLVGTQREARKLYSGKNGRLQECCDQRLLAWAHCRWASYGTGLRRTFSFLWLNLGKLAVLAQVLMVLVFLLQSLWFGYLAEPVGQSSVVQYGLTVACYYI